MFEHRTALSGKWPKGKEKMARGVSGKSSAAIFDLDRTLIAGAAGPVFARHLERVGLPGSPDLHPVPGLDVLRQFGGETPLAVQAARLSARASVGWPVADVATAAAGAAVELAAMLQPYVPDLIEDHRSEGRRLLLVATGPEPLAQALAGYLGFDGAVATRWDSADGCYTGQVEGPVLWGRAKVEAVEAWAEGEGVEMRASYVYGDSYFDAPLLAAAGRPVAVNPDAGLATVAYLHDWPIRYLDIPEGMPKVAGREIQSWFRPLQRPWLVPNARFEITGTELIPRTGPAIVVFNHRSYFDPVAIGLTMARANRPYRFLGKKEVFDAPVVGAVARLAGGIRVERSSGSEQPLEHALRALRAGEAVALAPQGTIPRGEAFFEPRLKGRWGAARLAHATRAPVIPVGVWGTERVWPRNSRLPRFDLRHRPLVQVQVGPPVTMAYRSVDADTGRIMAALVDLLPDEARIRKEPSPEELARTFPPSYRGDATRETERRPGTDT